MDHQEDYQKLQGEIEENLALPSTNDLWEDIENKDLAKYTPKQITQGMLQKNPHGETLYHHAAITGQLHKIPQELLTKKNLLQGDQNGWTSLHHAASKGHLTQIPKEILTEENLLKPSNDQWTCFHYAAGSGHLHQIPRELLTAKNLLHPDNLGRNCLDFANQTDNLEKIPPLPLTTLTALKSHFKTNNFIETKNILTTLNTQIERETKKLKTIANSLKQTHEKIL